MVEVRGHDLLLGGGSRTVGRGDGSGAGLRVPGDVPVLTGAADAHSEDAGGVAVTVAVVFIPAAVTARPHKYGAFPISTSVDSLKHQVS